ncbi:MAG: glycoside hydrolase family 3 protein [Ruminococcaceae bacterium]|nr:glycoside hydrolase family 3 protein [Oscillospiraceae bacterium]
MTKRFNIIITFFILISLLFGCANVPKNPNTPKPEVKNPKVIPLPPIEVGAYDVEEILSKMSLEEKIYQMMFVTPETISSNVKDPLSAETMAEYPVGGIIYFSNNLANEAQIKKMISETQNNSRIKLFIGVDEEGGRVSRLSGIGSIEKLSPMKEIGDAGDTNKATEVGKHLGKGLKELGFNVDFAPVADVIIREDNNEIGDRSFGTDANVVALMVGEFVKGIEEEGVLSVLKHFPGHGSTYANSHNGYSESERELNELRQTELLPFKKGIESGSKFVMVSHMTLVNATEEKLPSSLSKEVITDLLINELSFKGIVITDSMSMGAITNEYSKKDATLMCIKAGADMILMPPSPKDAFDAIYAAVQSGEITEERINESVRKILKVKKEKGII